MRLTMWFAFAALLAGGCASSCPGGGCAPGQSLFNLPMARYGEREIPTPCGDGSCSTGSCSTGACSPMPYLTFSKYLPCMDGWATRQTAKSCANRMLWRQFFQCYRVPSKHYRDGFRQAFIDVAEGEDGQLPAVPPPKYWNAHYRTESGARKVESWFGGYRAGSAMALIELAPLRRISASYDWSVEKPRDQFARANCLPGMCLTDQSGGLSGASMMAGLQAPMPGYPGYSQGVGGFAPPTSDAPPYDPAGSVGPGYGPPQGYDPGGGYGAAPGYGDSSGYDPGYDPNGGIAPGYSAQPYGGAMPDGQAFSGPPQGYGPADGYSPGPGYAPPQNYGPGPAYGPQSSYAPQPNYGPGPDYGQSPYGAGPGYQPGPGYGPAAGYGPAPGTGPANGYGPAPGSPPNAGHLGQSHQVNPGETTGRSHFYNPASPGGLSQRRDNLQTPYWAKPGAGDPADSPPPGVPNDGPVWRMAPTQN